MPSDILFLVELLASIYPEDWIAVINAANIEFAVEAANRELMYCSGGCLNAKVAAGARLFYELVSLHPLFDGNKRLAALTLATYAHVNGLRVSDKRKLKDASIEAAKGAINFNELLNTLRKHLTPAPSKETRWREAAGSVLNEVRDLLNELREYDLKYGSSTTQGFFGNRSSSK